MPRREKNRWTAAENALLIEHYNTATPQQLEAMFPNHTLTRIKDHATWLRKNGANIPVRKPTSGGDMRNRTWTEAEKTTLLQHWGTATEAELAQLLPGRTMCQCSTLIVKLRRQGISIPRRAVVTAPRWTPEEDAILIQNWGVTETKLLLEKLPGRTLQQCEIRASMLRGNGVHVPPRHQRLAQTSQARSITKLQASLNNKRPDRGVNIDKRNKWLPSIRICGKTYILGRFNDKNDAIAVRRQADEIVRQFLVDLKAIASDTDIEQSNQNWSKKLEEIDQALIELKQSTMQQQTGRNRAAFAQNGRRGCGT